MASVAKPARISGQPASGSCAPQSVPPGSGGRCSALSLKSRYASRNGVVPGYHLRRCEV